MEIGKGTQAIDAKWQRRKWKRGEDPPTTHAFLDAIRLCGVEKSWTRSLVVHQKGRETKEQYLARLEAAAKSLPRSYCQTILRRMRENVQAIVYARGVIPKND